MKKHNGFTLAEVLITLGIIGVVAAITLPAINSSTGSARNRALLKKGLSTLNSAVMMNEAREGWNFASIDETGCFDNSNARDHISMCGLLNSNLNGETQLGGGSGIAKTITNTTNNSFMTSHRDFVTYELQDGITIGMAGSVTGCIAPNGSCVGFIDINGDKGPNKIIECSSATLTFPIWSDSYARCEVNADDTADVFPVTYYNSTVELATNAAKAYFNAK